MAQYEGVALANILCRSTGPGDASLAASWSQDHNLTNVMVWGDTTDYMYNTFVAAMGGSYPSTMVVDLDTMELRYFEIGDVHSSTAAIEEILNADHPCAEY